MGIRTEHAVSEIGRTLMTHLLPGTDMIPGILAVCREEGIRFGYVASLIGSLSRVRLTYVKSASGSPGGLEFVPPLEREGPFEVLSAQGTLGEDRDGTPSLHLHVLLCDGKGKAFGGHILDTGNTVLATLEVAIRETRGIRLIRSPDEETGANLFRVHSGFA